MGWIVTLQFYYNDGFDVKGWYAKKKKKKKTTTKKPNYWRIWLQITHEGWYAKKQRNQTIDGFGFR